MATGIAAATQARAAGLAETASQYLTFVLGGEVYGIEILKVQEIIGMMPVTRVPRAPEYMRGVINLRGKVIPVIDLRARFSMETREDTNRTCIIVVQMAVSGRHVTMGIIVDGVSEVMDIAGEQIEPAPSFGADVKTQFILGMGKVANKVIMLLDVDKVLSMGEVEALNQSSTE